MKLIQLILFWMFVMPAQALTLEELELSFQANRLRITDESATNLSELRGKYQAALDKIRKKRQSAGNLDEVLLIDEEIKLVESKTWPLPPLAKGAPAELVSARKIYFKAYLGQLKRSGRELVTSADKMKELLDKKVVELTKSGDVAGAQKARAQSKALDGDQEIGAARALLSRVRDDGSAPVAWRVRRAGDNLEVLVRYDSGGKVSADSKVENVREITGGQGERGDTRAETLGEFLGIKGYEVDPYVALKKTFNDKELGPGMHATDLKVEFQKKDAEKEGVRLVSIANPKNTYVSFGRCLPTVAEKGTFRITVDYFIPETNVLMEGFKFFQSEGGMLQGSLALEGKGKWINHQFTSSSIGKSKMLLFYLHYSKDANGKQNPGDYITIASTMVKHIAFTAYLVESFDRDGAISESLVDAAKQKPVATNGVLIPQE